MHLATFHGLHEWHKCMFESLGWVVLASLDKSDDHKDHRKAKMKEYLREIESLKYSLELKMKTLLKK